ncbi:hypothetical protein GGG16DRAFT_106622 [Schizophyllum commune]
MAHPYANAAGYILASDAISQDEYRYKQGVEDDDRRPTHRRRWSFGFGPVLHEQFESILSLKYGIFCLVDDHEAPLLLFEWKDSVALDYADFGEHYATSQSKGGHPTNSPSTTSNTTAYIISPTRGYVYPDDTWSVMTPGTPSVMRLGFDGRVGARTPDPFGRGVTPEPLGRAGARTPEPGRAFTGRLTPEFGRAMMRTPEPGGWWAAETSRMWLTPEPDAPCSGWAGMGCFTNGKMGCVARMRWKGRQMKKGVKSRARKTAAALRRLASAMKGDAKA